MKFLVAEWRKSMALVIKKQPYALNCIHFSNLPLAKIGRLKTCLHWLSNASENVDSLMNPKNQRHEIREILIPVAALLADSFSADSASVVKPL